MLIRIRSKDGNFRFELPPNSDIAELLAKILETTENADENTLTISNQPRGNEAQISTLKGRTLQSIGLNHGDLIFVSYQPKGTAQPIITPQPSSSQAPTSAPSEGSNKPWDKVTEDPVDSYWRARDGKIQRKRDAQFCKHGPKGMCDYCMPLEPYDATYHKDHAIKHLSYHAYLRKVEPKGPSLGSTSYIPPLSPLSYKVKIPCPTGTHLPWPGGICSHCQPSAITLQPQPFRMVDHLEIASTNLIDRFLGAWRNTGLQRFGWLLGHYEPYEEVPLGVKAVVEVIYEPPQQGELDGLSLGLPWEDEQRIREISASATTPLTVVGYIFTDLTADEEDRTKTVYKRHPQSFYLSSLEAIFAATLQKANPLPSKASTTGQFSSRLVTAILTATEDGQIDVSAYQVSEQACAMVEADMIEASVEPGVVRVKEEDRTQESARYVPDVFFTYKNQYGLEVKKSAKPAFPVEYLMVNVTHGFPQNPAPLFRSVNFSIENRPGLEDQTVEKVMSKLLQFDAPNIQISQLTPPGNAHKRYALAEWLSDWHLVAFLGTTQLLSVDDMKVFMKTVTSPDLTSETTRLDALLQTEGWQTLMTFTRESAVTTSAGSVPPPSSGMDEDAIPQDILDQIAAESSGGATSTGNIRICQYCTFENTHGGTDCEVCGLPLSQ